MWHFLFFCFIMQLIIIFKSLNTFFLIQNLKNGQHGFKRWFWWWIHLRQDWSTILLSRRLSYRQNFHQSWSWTWRWQNWNQGKRKGKGKFREKWTSWCRRRWKWRKKNRDNQSQRKASSRNLGLQSYSLAFRWSTCTWRLFHRIFIHSSWKSPFNHFDEQKAWTR